MTKFKNAKSILAISIILMLLCSLLIVGIDTSWGDVDVKLGTLISDNGSTVNYKIYIPRTATTEIPAPAMLYGVGGGDGLDAGRNFAIEVSRRGFVVMVIDVPGNGLSESTSSVVRFDANNKAVTSSDDPTHCHELAFRYLSGLPFVDSQNMVTGGHSMGGMYTMLVAQNHQDQVKLQCNVGMNMYGNAELGYDFNFAFILGSSDESALVRTTNYNTLNDIYQAPALKAVFGLGEEENLIPEQIYGDFTKGTGRLVTSPHTLHIWEPYSKGVVTSFLSVLEQTMDLPNPIASRETVFVAREYLTIAMIVLLAAFATSLACILLDTRTFETLKLNAPKYTGFEGKTPGWWAGSIAIILLTGFSVIWCYMQTGSGEPNFFSRYGNSGAKCIWSLVTGAALLAYILVYYFAFGKKKGMNLASSGLATSNNGKFSLTYILKAAFFAVVVFGVTLGAYLLYYYFTKSNLQFIVFEIDPIPLQRACGKFGAMIFWMLPFVFMNAMAQRTVIHFEDGSKASTVKNLIWSNILCTLLLLVIHIVFISCAYFGHVTIFHTSRGYIGGEQVLGIVIGTLIINTIGFFVNKKANNVWAGVFTSLLFVAWFQVTASGMTF